MSGRPVGPGHPCYVIAEAGANHNRDLDIARKLIDVAADAGADAVKFQTYSGTTLYSTKTPRFDYLDDELADKPAHELLEEISLPRDWQPILAAHCRDRGVEFLSAPFEAPAGYRPLLSPEFPWSYFQETSGSAEPAPSHPPRTKKEKR